MKKRSTKQFRFSQIKKVCFCNLQISMESNILVDKKIKNLTRISENRLNYQFHDERSKFHSKFSKLGSNSTLYSVSRVNLFCGSLNNLMLKSSTSWHSGKAWNSRELCIITCEYW